MEVVVALASWLMVACPQVEAQTAVIEGTPPALHWEQRQQPGEGREGLVEGALVTAPAEEFSYETQEPSWLPLERGSLFPQVPFGYRFGTLSDDYAKDSERIAVDKAGKYKPTTNITAQLQTDFGWFGQDEVNRATVGNIPDGAFFRRARLGVFGELYETVEYRVEFDFAGDARPRFLDNWIACETFRSSGMPS